MQGIPFRKSMFPLFRMSLLLGGVLGGLLFLHSLDAKKYHHQVAERMREPAYKLNPKGIVVG